MFSPCRRKLQKSFALLLGFWVVVAVAFQVSCSANKAQPGQIARPSPAPSTSAIDRASDSRSVLRVCSDPNNLPFSNQKLAGFENRIASLVGRELNLKVEYTWWAQRRGFVRNTLKQGLCDVIIGMPTSSELALTTKPYYRSTYVFVTRRDRALDIQSLDDAALTSNKIGVQLIGDDFANTPPAHALTNRNIVQNVKGFSVYGDYGQPNPPELIIEAVVRRDVDVAIVWGPLAGYFQKHQKVPLVIKPVSPQIDIPYLPFVFDISMGVRRGDEGLKERLDEIIDHRQHEISQILDEFGVPRADLPMAKKSL